MRQEVINILEKAVKMRSAQKRYFKSKGRDDLIESKRLEIELDSELPSLIARLQKPA